MRIILLHGDHAQKSYERLRMFIKEARKRNWEVVRIDGENDKMSEELVKRGLFEKESIYIVTNLPKINKKELIWLKKNNDRLDGTLIFYIKGAVSKSLINALPKPDKVEEFGLPKLIWSFLESFYPGNSTNCIKLFHEVLENEPSEFVFALLARQVRDLVWAGLEGSEKHFPSWKLGKLRTQARKFINGQATEILNELAEIDIKVKTSKANLTDSLDFLIISRLE